jgi:uncharacterized protein YggE
MDYLSSRKLQAMAIISAVALAAVAGAFFTAGNAPVQQAYSLNAAGEPTIKVTGDASTSLVPDQTTLIVNVQTKPGDLASVLDEQEEKINEVTKALLATGNNQFELTVGQKSVYPYYSGYGTPSGSDVTFNIYASVAISTNIDELSELVNGLADAGFAFESVYFDYSYSQALLQKAEIIDELVDGNETDSDLSENPITVGVSLSTEPAVLTEALAEYEQKYRDLLAVLDGLGIPEDRIQQNSFNIYPYYSGYSPASTYSAHTQLIIKMPVFNIERMTNALNQVDNAFVENVYISVSDEAIDDARADLTEQAIDNAEERAQETAESLDMKVKRITSIDVVPSSPNPYGGEIFYRGVKVVQPYYYQSITGEISVSVTAQFDLEENDAA